MTFNRRAIIAGLGSAATSFASATPLASEAPSGRASRTRREWDAIIRTAFGGGAFN
jgi:hypothetical protein